MAHTPLVTRAELTRFGISGDFLAQFDVRPIQIATDTAGALGTAAFKWRELGESVYSQVVTSSSRAPWEWTPPGSNAVITFAAGTYATTAVYTIDEDGTVTRSGAGPDTVTATRFDRVDDAITSATEQAVGMMRPRMTLPLVSWGAAVKQGATDIIRYLLKSAVGLAPISGAPGDENIRIRYEDAMAYFRAIGNGKDKPPDIVDGSSGGTGAGLMVQPATDGGFGDERAGW